MTQPYTTVAVATNPAHRDYVAAEGPDFDDRHGQSVSYRDQFEIALAIYGPDAIDTWEASEALDSLPAIDPDGAHDLANRLRQMADTIEYGEQP